MVCIFHSVTMEKYVCVFSLLFSNDSNIHYQKENKEKHYNNNNNNNKTQEKCFVWKVFILELCSSQQNAAKRLKVTVRKSTLINYHLISSTDSGFIYHILPLFEKNLFS